MTIDIKAYGAEFDVGDLVNILLRDDRGVLIPKIGVVMDYFSSNVYEPSCYQVLVDGEPQYIQSNKVRLWKNS